MNNIIIIFLIIFYCFCIIGGIYFGILWHKIHENINQYLKANKQIIRDSKKIFYLLSQGNRRIRNGID